MYFIKILQYTFCVHSAVFTLLAAFYASIDSGKHSFIYFTRFRSACYDKFQLIFISTDFSNGTFYILRNSSRHGGLFLHSYIP